MLVERKAHFSMFKMLQFIQTVYMYILLYKLLFTHYTKCIVYNAALHNVLACYVIF